MRIETWKAEDEYKNCDFSGAIIGTEEAETTGIAVTKTVDTKETEDRNPGRGIVDEVSWN